MSSLRAQSPPGVYDICHVLGLCNIVQIDTVFCIMFGNLFFVTYTGKFYSD